MKPECSAIKENIFCLICYKLIYCSIKKMLTKYPLSVLIPYFFAVVVGNTVYMGGCVHVCVT